MVRDEATLASKHKAELFMRQCCMTRKSLLASLFSDFHQGKELFNCWALSKSA